MNDIKIAIVNFTCSSSLFEYNFNEIIIFKNFCKLVKASFMNKDICIGDTTRSIDFIIGNQLFSPWRKVVFQSKYKKVVIGLSYIKIIKTVGL